MAQVFKSHFFQHVKILRQAVSDAGAEAIMPLDSWEVLIRRGPSIWVMHPQFNANINGIQAYVKKISDNCYRFAGWLPYQNKKWLIATDKIAFKRFSEINGIPTPEYSLDVNSIASNVLIKRSMSSFGNKLYGPFRNAPARALDVSQGEYYEKFIEGTLFKIWFWDGIPICSERDVMTSVCGDGQSNLRDLILIRAGQFYQNKIKEQHELLGRCETIIRYYGNELDTVPSKGKSQIVDFRYGNDLMQDGDREIIDYSENDDDALGIKLRQIGKVLFEAIPQEIRPHTLFTLDAILDNQPEPQMWFLEMNSNPAVHPLVYKLMIKDLLSTNQSKAGGSPAMPGKQ